MRMASGGLAAGSAVRRSPAAFVTSTLHGCSGLRQVVGRPSFGTSVWESEPRRAFLSVNTVLASASLTSSPWSAVRVWPLSSSSSGPSGKADEGAGGIAGSRLPLAT